MSKNNNKNTFIKIMYFRDQRNANRVMTVIAKIDRTKDEISFAYSINRPSEWKMSPAPFGYKNEYQLTHEKGDNFSKQKGRKIALGRLATRPIFAELKGLTVREALNNRTIKEIVCETLLESVQYIDPIAKRLAADVLINTTK